MRKRVFLLGALMAFVVICLPVFASGQQDKGSAPAPAASKKFTSDNITLTMWTFIDPAATSGRGKILNDLIKKFQADHPNVKINTEVQQWTELLAKQTAAFYAGNAPDIMWNAAEYITGILSIGAYEPFENLFLSEWGKEDNADVTDALWGAGTTDGKHYFFDITRSPYGIAYRADLFNKYGLSAKSSDYRDITDFMKALTVLNGKVENGVNVWGWGTGYNPHAPSENWVVIGLAAAGELFNKNGTANFATKTGVQMMEFQKAMIDDLKVMPKTAIVSDYEDVYNDFKAGKYAAIIASAARMTVIRNSSAYKPMDVQVMSFPSVNGNKSKDISGGWCIGVNSKSAHKYEAGKFVELLGSREADWAFTNEAGQLANRVSTYTAHPDSFQKPENQYIVVFKDIMVNNVLPIPPFAFVGTKEVLLDAFTDYYINGMTAMAALQKAEQIFNERNKKK